MITKKEMHDVIKRNKTTKEIMERLMNRFKFNEEEACNFMISAWFDTKR